jgi:hypothetical protein
LVVLSLCTTAHPLCTRITTYSVHLFLKRKCGRILPAGPLSAVGGGSTTVAEGSFMSRDCPVQFGHRSSDSCLHNIMPLYPRPHAAHSCAQLRTPCVVELLAAASRGVRSLEPVVGDPLHRGAALLLRDPSRPNCGTLGSVALSFSEIEVPNGIRNSPL